MTTNYNIEIISHKSHFKVTYRDGKFRKLEFLRGRISDIQFLSIGAVIPLKEERIEYLIDNFKDKVIYTKIIKEKSLYSQFLSEWYSFYKSYTKLPPKFTGADGNALKAIIKYLQQVATTDQEALNTFRQLLSNWQNLSKFHQQNTDLKYINSKLNIIIEDVKRNSKSKSNIDSYFTDK